MKQNVKTVDFKALLDDKGIQFNIYPLESVDHKNSFVSGPERLTKFELICVKKGNGVLTVDLKSYVVSENIIYCLAPGQFRSLHFEEGIEGHYISLSHEFLYLAEGSLDFAFLEAQYAKGGDLPVAQLNAEVLDLVTRMENEFMRNDSLRFEILRGLLKVLMIYLSRLVIKPNLNESMANPKDVTIVKKFFGLLTKNFTSKKLVANYADELCITPNYLNSVVKKQTGFPASHHIQQRIIMEAKKQALYSSLRMKEIADLLGFEDYAHFSKFFKNYSGVNFSSFRKALNPMSS